MRQLIIAILISLPLTIFASTTLKTVVLDVQNMTCSLCPITVKKSLEKVAGVNMAKVDYSSKTATVTYDPDKIQLQMLIVATTNAGYPSTVRK
ncbi:heavy-metal-associated domain-containing protein [Candidatus Nitrosoglobus terrae]|uniref:heavy-metal-associated domain-containing protein n=1 Tax=Candidatus Nitrosoglobus terrae TaxID=1630141 RepID=UPI000BBA6A04|nr:cation transporter [Candidatus Nitrosoglobus terrae]